MKQQQQQPQQQFEYSTAKSEWRTVPLNDESGIYTMTLEYRRKVGVSSRWREDVFTLDLVTSELCDEGRCDDLTIIRVLKISEGAAPLDLDEESDDIIEQANEYEWDGGYEPDYQSMAEQARWDTSWE